MRKMTYAEEIDKVLGEHETLHPCPSHSLEWVANRIDWCWKWKKITRAEMEEYADRVCALFERR